MSDLHHLPLRGHDLPEYQPNVPPDSPPEAPVSARDDIHERIHGIGYCDPPCGLCKEVADLLDAYAHELAEKIRGDSWSRRDRWGRYEREDYEAGQCHGADLIDPEAS